MLSAIPGFKQISGRRLSNDEVGTSDRRLAMLPWSQHLNLCACLVALRRQRPGSHRAPRGSSTS